MSGDSGSASLYVLAAVALVAVLSIPATVMSVGYAAHRSAVLAADLAALGGAQASLDDVERACAVAANVSVANGAQLQQCSLTGESLQVEVTMETSLALLPEVSATSRAGVRP